MAKPASKTTGQSASKPAYRRVIVKVSGEALSGPEGFGIHQPTIDRIAKDLIAARRLGVTLGVVVGGGNILRGVKMSGKSLSRPTADAMGMLATVMNGLVLEAAIERLGAPARTMSALNRPQVCETYERGQALRHFEENRIVVFAGGTGNPFFTTDTTAVLRAAEMECEAVLKAIIKAAPNVGNSPAGVRDLAEAYALLERDLLPVAGVVKNKT